MRVRRGPAATPSEPESTEPESTEPESGEPESTEPGSTESEPTADVEAVEPDDPEDAPGTPVYARLLRLHHVHPGGVARAVLGEGMIALAVVLSLADLASAWSILVLPLAVAVVVKAHDLLAGVLMARGPGTTTAPPP